MTGQYTDRFGLGLGGFHATIDCLYVEGNQAWVSGIVTHGALLDPDEGELDLTGWPVATRVRDNGTSANDPPDEISYSWLEAGAFDCNTHPEVVLFEVPQGQVTVK